MTTLLMCEPKYFDVQYKINPWMTMQTPVDPQLALQQWQQLVGTLKQCGADIQLVPPEQAWPDMVFTANAALVRHGRVFLAEFYHPERQGERFYFKHWFEHQGFQLCADQSDVGELHAFEGAGDALYVQDTLFLAHGFRSDPRARDMISRCFPDFEVVELTLVDPRFYHLDTCFCPLNDTEAIFYPGAFTEESQEKLQQYMDCWPVPEADAERFACNAVVINQNVVLTAGCDATAEHVASMGWTPHLVETSEFLKSGGSAKCLTLAL